MTTPVVHECPITREGNKSVSFDPSYGSGSAIHEPPPGHRDWEHVRAEQDAPYASEWVAA